MESKICRTCLHDNGTIPLFCETYETDVSVQLMRIANVNIEQLDGLPDHICASCEAELRSACYFVDKVKESEKSLRLRHAYVSVEADNKDDIPIKFEPESDYDMPEMAVDDMPHMGDDPADEKSIKRERTKRIKSESKTKVKRKKVEALIPCEVCGLRVVSQSALVIHMRVHTGEKPFACDRCTKRYRTSSQLKVHMDTHLNVTRKRAKRIHNAEKKFKCPSCDIMCYTPSALKIHLISHSGETPFQCSQCPKQFRYQGSLKSHMDVNHSNHRERKYTCDHCGLKFYSKSTLKPHLLTHMGLKPFLCEQCPQRFTQQGALIRHTRTHTGERPYPCPVCGKRFPCTSSLRNHKVKHSSELKFECEECHKMFKTKDRLNTHSKLHRHKEWVCNYCGMEFTWKNCMEIHIRRVHSERSGQCDICMKHVSDLEVHMRKHLGVKPFTCDQCDAAFTKQVSLTKHKQYKHMSVGKYKCTIHGCSLTFPIPSMLEFHVLKHHTNGTPHICRHCSKGYIRLCDLNKHLRVYHSDVEDTIKKSPKENN